MADPFDEIDAVYQAVGEELLDRDDLQNALRELDPDEARSSRSFL